jgi:hypothetical protein
MSKRVLIAGLAALIAAGVAATLAVLASADGERKARGGKVIRLEACGEHEEANVDLPNPAGAPPRLEITSWDGPGCASAVAASRSGSHDSRARDAAISGSR